MLSDDLCAEDLGVTAKNSFWEEHHERYSAAPSTYCEFPLRILVAIFAQPQAPQHTLADQVEVWGTRQS